jgi:copper transport protein
MHDLARNLPSGRSSAHPVFIVACVVAAVLALPTLLLAHQYLRAAAPADGDRLDAVPAEIRLTFSEAVRLDFTELTVQGPEGLLNLGPLMVDPDDRAVLIAPVAGGWHAGEFSLRWTTVGSDGHRTSGNLGFAVLPDAAGLSEHRPEEEPVAAEEMPGPHHDPRLFPETQTFGPGSAGYVAIRALLFAALVAMLGAVVLRLVILPTVRLREPYHAAALISGADRGAARLGVVAAAAFGLATAGRLLAQSVSLFGPDGALDPERLGQTLSLRPWALGWWLQAGAAVLAMAGFSLAARGRFAGWGIAASAALLAAVTPALSGHAVALGQLAWLAVPVDAIHVVAAGGWVGGLLAVIAVGLPAALRLRPDERGGAASALVQAFSPVALAFTAALLTTGVVSAWLHLGEVEALWTTPYGRTLLLKVAIFSAVALVGAYNFLRVRPALAGERGAAMLRRSGAIELLLALAVITVTAVLVAIPPPAE